MKRADKKNLEDVLPLTPMQEGMLFHYLKDRESDYYFEQLSLTITGEIDLARFKQAWALVVETNEILRTRFIWEKLTKPLQVILKESPLHFIFHDFSNGKINQHGKKINENGKRNLVQEIRDNDRKNKFNLNSVPFRITLCKLGKAEYEMLISNHHILYDGWSNGILLKEFFSFYHQLEQKKSPAKFQKSKYREYISWLQGQDVQWQRGYWARYLNGFDTRSELSIKRREGKNINTAAPGNSHHNIKFSQIVKEKLEIFIKSHQVTLAGLLYSAWGILLQRYSSSDDVIFGTTVSGRSSEVKGIEDIVGLFINTVPLRVRTNSSGHEKITGFLYRVNRELREREGYESTSLVEIKEYGEVVFDGELFDTIVVIENYPLDKVLSQGNDPLSLSVDSYSIFETTHYDLTVGITLMEDIEVEFTYNRDLFEESVIKELSRHFVNIVEDLVDNPGKELAALEILSAAEKDKILFEFNNTAADYAGDKTIDQLFAGQVERIPDHVALIGQIPNSKFQNPDNDAPFGQLSYRELNERSSRLAYLLREKGIGLEAIVALRVKRSLEMILGIFGILKAGGAYLPIDPDYPAERIDYMLKDSGATLLVTTNNEEGEKVRRWEGEIYYLEELLRSSHPLTFLPSHPLTLSPSYLQNSSNPATGHRPPAASLAYIIYTSGSTGKPKGVMIEHAAVLNRLFWVRDKYRLNERDVILQATSFVFDVSVCEMFRWIPAGGRLCLLPPGGEKDPGEIVKTIARNRVTTADFIPAMLALLLDYASRQNLVKELAALRWVWTGVEVVDMGLVNGFNQTLHRLNRTRLINAYGPTESTVDVTYFDCSAVENDDDVVPIGRPMANVRLYILARNGAVQPVGVSGQLCIAGKGLARGYLNNPELAAEKFVEYRSYKSYRSYILYRTGDLACWQPDGNVRFLGRMDHQVKIRGYRVELGEIESLLLRHEEIKDAVVVVRGGNEQEKELCAYITAKAKETNQIDQPGLREYLSNRLPDYMIPSYFVQLDHIPLTSSGKIDRKALPDPGIEPGACYRAPRDDIEKKLVDLWSGVLGVETEKISIDVSFFRLGGHSLKANALVLRINKEFNVTLPLGEIFRTPFIRGLAIYIKKSTRNKYIPLEKSEKKEYYELSSAQKRLFILEKSESKLNTAYNLPTVISILGKLNKERLESTFHELIKRHESLRTSFQLKGDTAIQIVHLHTNVDFKIQYSSLREKEGQGEVSAFPVKNGITRAIEKFIKPFDISQPPLLRVELVELSLTEHLLLFDMHHIVSDGVSMGILIREFTRLYEGNKLPPLSIQYKDFSQWQNRWFESPKSKEQEDYWLNCFKGAIPVLKLETDFPRTSVKYFEGNFLTLEIDKEPAGNLKQMALATGTTLFQVLLAMYNILLSKYTQREDIIVGVPSAGRKHADLEDIIGMFVNTLPIRISPRRSLGFLEFLGKVKEMVVNSYENQDYPLEALVNKLNIPKDSSRNPLFDVMFVSENLDMPELSTKDLEFLPYEFENKITHLDLVLYFVETNNSIELKLEYSTRLFRDETARTMLEHYLEIVEQVVNNHGICIKDITLSHDFTPAYSTALPGNQIEFAF